MRLNDRGPAGPRGGANGRLFVHLRVQSDPRFERHGDDLHHEAHIAFTQAVLGATIEVPTLRESVAVDVTAGSATAPCTASVTRASNIFTAEVAAISTCTSWSTVPTELDDASETLLRQLAEHRNEPVLEAAGGLFHRRKAKK